MKIYDEKRQLVIDRTYTRSGRNVLKGQDMVGENKDMFLIRYKRNKPQTMSIQKEDGKEIGRVTFIYRGRRIVSRIREHNGDRYKCTYRYNRRGKIVAYSYYIMANGKWVLTKTLRLIY